MAIGSWTSSREAGRGPGDISAEGLGIAADLLEQLQAEVDIVINSAAVVSFDSPLDSALELNVLGAHRVAQFANSCPNAALIHVSTAYVSGTRRRLDSRDCPTTR